MQYENDVKNKVESHLLSLPDYSDNSFKFRISSAGSCIRELDYNYQRGRKPFSVDQAMRMHMGTAGHTMWQKLMSEALGDDFTDMEVEVKVDVCEGLTITGHPDGSIISLDAIWELKTVSDNSFDLVEQQGHALPAHYEQANMYGVLLGRKNIMFQYFNKNTCKSLYLMAPVSQELAIATKAKFKAVFNNKKTGAISARPYTDPTQSPCWYCPWRDECYQGFQSDIAGMASVTLSKEDDKDIYDQVHVAWSMRKTRLDADKQEQFAKQKVCDMLIKRGINIANIGEFSVEVKLGKNNNPIATVKELK